MILDELFKMEARDENSEHDKAYRVELEKAFNAYKDLPLQGLKSEQKLVWETDDRSFAGSHRQTAKQMVLFYFIEEKKK